VSVCGSFLEEPAHWRLLTTPQVNDIADARRIIGFYRLRWMIEQLFRTTKTKGFDIEALRQQQGRPLEKLVAATIIAAVTAMQLVAERDGKLQRPLGDAFDPGNQPVLERVGQSLEGKTEKQKNPHPKGSLAYASWVFARLRRLDRILRKAGAHRHAQRPHPIPRDQARLEPSRCVNRVAHKGRGEAL
jgi:hypothetical protein